MLFLRFVSGNHPSTLAFSLLDGLLSLIGRSPDKYFHRLIRKKFETLDYSTFPTISVAGGTVLRDPQLYRSL